MKSVITASIALLLVTVLPASARPPIAAVEEGHELEATMVTLPSTADGTVSVQGCSACKQSIYTLGRESRFYIAQREVTFGEFKRYLESKPAAAVFLANTPKLNVVTRLVAQ